MNIPELFKQWEDEYYKSQRHEDFDFAAFKGGMTAAAKLCGEICFEQQRRHQSPDNLQLRTLTGKDVAMSMGFGAANCATRICVEFGLKVQGGPNGPEVAP